MNSVRFSSSVVNSQLVEPICMLRPPKYYRLGICMKAVSDYLPEAAYSATAVAALFVIDKLAQYALAGKAPKVAKNIHVVCKTGIVLAGAVTIGKLGADATMGLLDMINRQNNPPFKLV
ncbi:MAG: hypothetical protein HY861_03920 [Chlamydiia bacterium]|nr:hypothetical protein [Chlamydiia bacterium]